MPEGAPDRPLRILVADDDPDTRASLRLVLTLLGHEVTEAADGAAALEAARATCPHLALIDLAMPGGNGLEVARRLRQDPSLRGLLLVALSGYGQEEIVALALAAGFDRHFLKPLDFEALQALLAAQASALAREEAGQPPRFPRAPSAPAWPQGPGRGRPDPDVGGGGQAQTRGNGGSEMQISQEILGVFYHRKYPHFGALTG